MLPHVHGEDGHGSFLGQGVLSSNSLGDLEARRGPDEPGPA